MTVGSDPISSSPVVDGTVDDGSVVIDIRWGDRLVEVVRCPRWGRARARLPDGTWLIARRTASGVLATVGATNLTFDDDTRVTHGGLSFSLRRTARVPFRKFPLEIESGTLHTVMVALAVHVSVVSALLLAPPPVPDPDAGGGIPRASFERLVRVSGGTAIHPGHVIEAAGRPLEEGERPQQPQKQTRGAHIDAVHTTPTASLADALAALDRMVHRGSPTGDLADALGDLVSATARAPNLGAGFGGFLTPAVLPAPGEGNGDIGIGLSRVKEKLKRARLEKSRPFPARTPSPVPDRALENASAELKSAVVDQGDARATETSLDPVVRDHLTRSVRRRQNAVRACYEAYGLAANADRAGRIVLYVTLNPDGKVTTPHVETKERALTLVGDCIEDRAIEWYLGAGLVAEPVRLAFPFILQPRASHQVFSPDDVSTNDVSE